MTRHTAVVHSPAHFRVVISFADSTSRLYLVIADSATEATDHVESLHPDAVRVLSVEAVPTHSRNYEVVG